MRRLLLIGVMLVAGCQSTVGPFQARSPMRVDAPGVPLQEQEARGRNRYALPDESRGVGPTAGSEYRGIR